MAQMDWLQLWLDEIVILIGIVNMINSLNMFISSYPFLSA